VELLSLYDSWTYQGHELDDMVLPFQMRMRMEELDPKDWDNTRWLWIKLFVHKTDGFEEDRAYQLVQDFIREGRLLLRYDEANKAKYAKTYAFETTMPPSKGVLDSAEFGDSKIFSSVPFLKAIAINLGHTNSKVFDSVWAKDCPRCIALESEEGDHEECEVCHGTGSIEPYDLMILFVRRKDNLWNVSLYSTKDDIDCGAIAKSFGGGGHKGAAGFQCDELPFEF
jgi:hypothetical protein